MRMLVVTSCTGDKATKPERNLTLDDFRDVERLRQREQELAPWMRPAGEMYTGQQHVDLMKGVRRLRGSLGDDVLTLNVLSAGYGLIPENRDIAPYDVSFNSMRRAEAQQWARHQGVPDAVRAAMADFPLVVFLLGAHYLQAIEPPIKPGQGQRIVFLARPGDAEILGRSGVTVVSAGRPQASRYGAGTISLKGRMFDLFARGLASQGEDLWKAVLADDTLNSFLRAVELGLRLEGVGA